MPVSVRGPLGTRNSVKFPSLVLVSSLVLVAGKQVNLMYAVIESGGKQHRVREGETLQLEKLDVPAGENICFDRVLLVGEGAEVRVGTPLVKGSQVSADVLDHGRGPKIDVVKFKRRKKYRRRQGHRQDYTTVKVTGIKAG